MLMSYLKPVVLDGAEDGLAPDTDVFTYPGGHGGVAQYDRAPGTDVFIDLFQDSLRVNVGGREVPRGQGRT